MPLCTLHLLSLQPSSHAIPEFLTGLHSSLPAESKPLVTARPIRWVITPSAINTASLLDPLSNPTNSNHTYTTYKTSGTSTVATAWDLLVILPGTNPLPSNLLQKHVRARYTLQAGVPNAVLSAFKQNNGKLLHPTTAPPPLTGTLDRPLIASEGQNLELTQELRDWCLSYWRHQGAKGKGAVSMLNLLAFAHPSDKAHESYSAYGKAFAESIGGRRGGTAKIVGKVVGGQAPASQSPSGGAPVGQKPLGNTGGDQDSGALNGGWEEIALAHYPSLEHFCDMAGSQDYQEVNRKFRMPALRDTCILMCSELDEGVVSGDKKEMSGGKSTPENQMGERADGIVGRSAKI